MLTMRLPKGFVYDICHKMADFSEISRCIPMPPLSWHRNLSGNSEVDQ
jgi:hypothetical protein